MTTTQRAAEPGATGDEHAPGDEHAGGEHASAPVAEHGSHGPHGYSKDKDAHLKRLRRIEGQVRGLQRMVEEDVYCIDILTQVSASTKALQSFALQLLEEHLRHCVAHAAREGGPESDAKIEEATAAIARLLRT
ncbi:metal-sensitive transcriptional regulator [Streptomyces sedi]|uniref:Metal-sensitive transcriptional regulator n=1 Tax=Streptomyces sedi TaxID=555059 RepID=A0A5C4UXF6_9ACTN|nr:metal-sensitive transcriptional regulator [Streptomyces sedi]TNM28394.1 metal-sensitive transcriptional regulator [Streptomyces sedi]